MILGFVKSRHRGRGDWIGPATSRSVPTWVVSWQEKPCVRSRDCQSASVEDDCGEEGGRTSSEPRKLPPIDPFVGVCLTLSARFFFCTIAALGSNRLRRASPYQELRRALSRADQDADNEHQHATHDDLKGCRKQWRVHVTVANPGDHRQLDCDDGHGDQHR
jgi:hypothetical protein